MTLLVERGHVVRIRDRQTSDLDACVTALSIAHRIDSTLPWPVDPYRWLCPAHLLGAWIAETPKGTVAGHLGLLRADPAATDTPTAEVSRLFVTPGIRRDTVATRLLHHAQRWAARHGVAVRLRLGGRARNPTFATDEGRVATPWPPVREDRARPGCPAVPRSACELPHRLL